MRNLVDIKPGDRLRYSSPLWKEVIVERLESNEYRCLKAKKENYINFHHYQDWQEGVIYPPYRLNPSLWEKISKSKNFGTLYDKLCNNE